MATPTAWSRKMTVNFDLALSSTNVIYHIDFVEFDHSFHLFILFYTHKLHTYILKSAEARRVQSMFQVGLVLTAGQRHIKHTCSITASSQQITKSTTDINIEQKQ